MEQVQAKSIVDTACDTIAAAAKRIALDRQVIAGLVAMIDDSRSNSDGHWPDADHTCIDCTLGCVPASKRCAYHNAKRLLAGLPVVA